MHTLSQGASGHTLNLHSKLSKRMPGLSPVLGGSSGRCQRSFEPFTWVLIPQRQAVSGPHSHAQAAASPAALSLSQRVTGWGNGLCFSCHHSPRVLTTEVPPRGTTSPTPAMVGPTANAKPRPALPWQGQLLASAPEAKRGAHRWGPQQEPREAGQAQGVTRPHRAAQGLISGTSRLGKCESHNQTAA